MLQKRVSVLLSLLILIPVLRCTVAWADLLDNCESESGPGSYYGLSLPEKDFIAWETPPDDSYLVQDSNRQEASAVYECPGAERVTIAIYSRHGSFASREGDALIRGGEEFPLEYDSAGGEVYCQGQRMVYDAAEGAFLFVEEENVPSRLKEYGLSVAASSDGQTYFKVRRTLLSARQESPFSYWYEVFEAELEEGTRFLRLTLTDQSSIEVVGREERYQFETTGGLSLASVEIIGTEEEPPGPSGEEPPSSSVPGEDDPASQPTEDEPPKENPPVDEPSEDDLPEDDLPEDDPWEEDPWEEEDIYWEEGIPWFGPEEGADALPDYYPGEEAENPTWGPEEDLYAGPAFPEEEEEEEEPPVEEPPPEVPNSSEGNASSQSSQKSQTPKKGSSSQAESNGEPEDGEEEKLVPVRIPDWESRPRTLPLWRRITQPEIITVILMTSCPLAAGLRILWSRQEEEGSEQERKEREEE